MADPLILKPGVSCGAVMTAQHRDGVIRLARAYEAGGFDSVWAGDHISFYVPILESMTVLSFVAGATERVQLGSSVYLLPLRHPTTTAKVVSTLDVLSGGRVVLGLGVGARVEDYAAAGAPFDARRLRRMEAQIATLRRVWAGENVVEGALRPVEPLPLQAGGPPLWAGALAADSIRRAAAWADGIAGFSFGPSSEEVAFAWDTARQAWRDAGRAAPPRLVGSCWFALGRDARAQLDEYLFRYLNFMGADVARALAPQVRTDSPAALRRVVADLAALGTDELLLVPTSSDPDELHRVADALF